MIPQKEPPKGGSLYLGRKCASDTAKQENTALTHEVCQIKKNTHAGTTTAHTQRETHNREHRLRPEENTERDRQRERTQKERTERTGQNKQPPPYTTRSPMVTGFGEGKGLKVVPNPVNGVAAGQELWFSNAGFRETNGAIFEPSTNGPGIDGHYWASNVNGSFPYYFYFVPGNPSSGKLIDYNGRKLTAFPVRCVR